MSQKTVILIEPSFYGVSYVKEAKKLDCYVIVVTSDSHHPQKYGYESLYDDILICDIRDAEQIFKAIQAGCHRHIDAIVAATDYAITNTAIVAAKLNIPYLSVACAKLVRNKDLARQCYAKHGVPSAQFAVVSNLDESINAASHIGYPVVLKPTNTASSQHVYFICDSAALTKAFIQMQAFHQSYMGFRVREEYLIEEYLDGPEFSVELFVENNELVFSEVTEKQTSQLPYFVETMHIFPTSILGDKKPEIIAVAAQALRAIGFGNGPAHVEVKYTKTGAKIVEVNGRPGGDNISSNLIPTAYHINIFEQAIRNVLAMPVTFTSTKAASCAIGFICAPSAGRLLKLTNIAQLQNDPAVIRYQIDAKPGDWVQSPTSSDNRLGFIIVKMPTPLQAKAKIIQLIESIKVVLEE